jgi:hypothetical protein
MVDDTDIAHVVARLVSQLPQSIAAQNFNANDEETFNAYVQRDAYDRVYSRGVYYHAAQEAPVEPEWVPPNEDNDYMPGLTG